ncbi:uncharacterized protein LOC133515825 [Cydia pomonella]|uniref:uncharacterized protein LOC133515825 n=1 Tax=Cydia pomonella TaxID=82600 RepID=UPI002ADDB446|nr:uncharacterized protein LOC133515825 [Cydia pomonella]
MNGCGYDSVNVNCDGEQNESKKLKSLARQIFICSGLWAMYFTPGLFLGVPPVYIAQSRKISNSTEAVSAEMASWICDIRIWLCGNTLGTRLTINNTEVRKKDFLLLGNS